MKRFLLGAVGLAIPFLSGCGEIVIVKEGEPINQSSDVRVDVRMNLADIAYGPDGMFFGNPVERCDWMGGRISYPELDHIYCEDID